MLTKMEEREEELREERGPRFEDSEEFAELRAMKKRTFVDEVIEGEGNAFRAGKKVAERMFENQVKKADFPKMAYKEPMDTVDIPGLDVEFEKEIKKRPGMRKELDRIDKKMKTALHLYNAQLDIATYTAYLTRDLPREERERVNGLLDSAQRVAFLLNKKLLEDLTKDKRELARLAGGLPRVKEAGLTTATTEEDKKELKEKKEEYGRADIHRLAISSSATGRGSITITAGNRHASYFGGQPRGGFSYRGRGSMSGGRTSQGSSRGGGRASQNAPAGRQ